MKSNIQNIFSGRYLICISILDCSIDLGNLMEEETSVATMPARLPPPPCCTGVSTMTLSPEPRVGQQRPEKDSTQQRTRDPLPRDSTAKHTGHQRPVVGPLSLGVHELRWETGVRPSCSAPSPPSHCPGFLLQTQRHLQSLDSNFAGSVVTAAFVSMQRNISQLASWTCNWP